MAVIVRFLDPQRVFAIHDMVADRALPVPAVG